MFGFECYATKGKCRSGVEGQSVVEGQVDDDGGEMDEGRGPRREASLHIGCMPE